MFAFLFSGIQAYQQVGMFIGALLCLGVGGFVLGSCLYWRVHALHATGTIIGVTANGAMYTPVYRYTLPDGQTHEARSDTSTGSTSGYETGRVVPLLISAHNPTEARQANSYLLEIIGAIFFVPGIWLGYTALTAYPITRMTWFMAAAMVIYLLERGRRILTPKGRRLTIEEWKRQHGLGQASMDLSTVKPIEQIAAATGSAQSHQQLQQKKWAPVVVGLVAIALVAIGILQGVRIAQLETAGIRTHGDVVDLKEEYSSGNGGNYSYYPIVRYRTQAGADVEFKDSVGSNPPTHQAGDRVQVLYLATRPSGAIIDRGAFLNWAIPALLLAGSCFLAWLTLFLKRSAPRQPLAECTNSSSP